MRLVVRADVCSQLANLLRLLLEGVELLCDRGGRGGGLLALRVREAYATLPRAVEQLVEVGGRGLFCCVKGRCGGGGGGIAAALERAAGEGGGYGSIRQALNKTPSTNVPLRATRCRTIMVLLLLLLAMVMVRRRKFRKSSGQGLGAAASGVLAAVTAPTRALRRVSGPRGTRCPVQGWLAVTHGIWHSACNRAFRV